MADITQPPSECRPPCWNSLTPGIADPAAIADFYTRLGVDPEDISTVNADTPGLKLTSAFFGSFPYDFPDLPPRIAVLWASDHISSVALYNLELAFIGLPKVIESPGTPEQIYVWIDARVEVRYFTVILRYPNIRTTVFASGTMVWNEPQNDELVCFTDDAGILVDVLFSSESTDIYQDMSLWMDYPVNARDLRDELVWTSFSSDPTTQPSEFQMDAQGLSQLLVGKDACLPPLFQ